MKTLRVLILASTCFAVLFVVTPPAVAQQEPPTVVQQGWLSYSAKFVCGREDPGAETTVGGRYRTVVNIHNPHYLTDNMPVLTGGLPVPVVFLKKAVVALPQGNKPLRPSCKQVEFLNADHALAVSCRNIVQLYAQTGITIPRPFEGFVVIEVPPQPSIGFAPELDVTAVYTASKKLEDDGVQTLDVEQVEPKVLIGFPEGDECNGNPR